MRLINTMLKAAAIRSKNYSDNWETPAELYKAVIPKILPVPADIWEPFIGCTNLSTKTLQSLGHNVFETNTDFFDTEWPHENGQPRVLLSNPPFSQKFKVLERLLIENKPFLLLVPAWVYASATFRNMVKKHDRHDVQLVVPPMRVHYVDPETHLQRKGTAFDSVFIASGVYNGKQLIFV
ncbi:MAG: hypothetical protein CMJ08_05885 [Pelagibacterales bacterium]|nr:hypothetical protein [Pelagibacterales bacterium]|tara:strand:- start:1841 stop:2380 length:540 start_codon:yes stop_codon:yes gene_type:complete